MKASVIYFSQSGKTKAMAEAIVAGMTEGGLDTKAFSVDAVDKDWIKASDCVIIGSPTYYSDISAKMMMFLETLPIYNLPGKLGGAFATAGYVHGGDDIAMQTILTHMLVCGMVVYSGGGSKGNPVIHQGPVSVGVDLDADTKLFQIYGKRMAEQTQVLFGNK